MSRQQYIKITNYITSRPRLKRGLLFLNKALTFAGFLAYPVFLIYIICNKGYHGTAAFRLPYPLLVYTMGPGLFFVLLTIFRKAADRPRPYEALSFSPVIHKKREGQSFPSRHVFCFALIALLWYPYNLCAGLLLTLSALLLAMIRVIGGVHYISDVTAGILTGMAAGILINAILI